MDEERKPDDVVGITELQGGVAIRMIDDALKHAVINCLDPNASAKKNRKVNLTVTISPSEDRNGANVEISVTTTLAPPREKVTHLYFGVRGDGSVAAKEAHIDQSEMFVDDKIDDSDNVTRIGAAEGEGK